MRFSIDIQTLKAAIEVTSHATTNSNLTPILENILIDVQYKKVILTGNNLEMAIEYTIEKDIDIESEGKFTISSKFLTSFMALQQWKRIKIELETGNSLKFTTDSWETRFKWVSAEKYPVIPRFTGNTPLRIRWKDIRVAIEKTILSTAEGNIRPMLAGIYIRTQKDTIVFASTDSFRLSEFRILWHESIENTGIIIPEKTAIELARIIEDNNSYVELYIHENQLMVAYESIKLSSRLLSGRFPDYEWFFPKKYNTKWVILRTDLMNATKQINLVARENNYNTRFRFDLNGKLELSTGDTEIWASTAHLATSVEWQEGTIGLNSQYLLEVLSVIKEDYVSIDFETPLSPIVIKWVPEETKEYGYRHLIMPLKI